MYTLITGVYFRKYYCNNFKVRVRDYNFLYAGRLTVALRKFVYQVNNPFKAAEIEYNINTFGSCPILTTIRINYTDIPLYESPFSVFIT